MKNIELIIELTRRRIVERYIGSSFRLLWVFLSPIFPIATNLLVFYFVAKLPESRAMGVMGYTMFLFSAILPFRFFQRSISECSSSLNSNMDLFKSVPISLGHITITAICVQVFELMLQLVVLAILGLLLQGTFSFNLVLLIPAFIILFVTCVGLGSIFAIVGYLARDIEQVTQIVLGMVLYLTPATYSISSLPKRLQIFANLNPLTHMIIVFRDALAFKGEVHWQSWIIFTGIACSSAAIGLVFLQKIQGVLGDLV